jgi:hypothetical protein
LADINQVRCKNGVELVFFGVEYPKNIYLERRMNSTNTSDISSEKKKPEGLNPSGFFVLIRED